MTDIANSAKNNDTSTAAASSSVSQEATKFQVKIRIKEKEIFLPGMSVTAEIETRSRTNVITVPIQCVTTRLPKEAKGKNGSTNAVETAATNTSETKIGEKRKSDDPPKPVEIVFVLEGDHVKKFPVKRGISDDNYTEITDGLKEGAEVITGPYKALSRDLDDDTKVVVGTVKMDKEKKEN